MSWVEREARRVKTKYPHLAPQQIAEREGLQVIDNMPLPIQLVDMLCLDTIAIQPGIDPAMRNIAIAHCLGHYFMHDGNQVWFGRQGSQSRPKQEGQANEFAAWLLAPRAMHQRGNYRDVLRWLLR